MQGARVPLEPVHEAARRECVGDALRMLGRSDRIDHALRDPSAAGLAAPVPLHLAGFSFGSHVQSRVAERIDPNRVRLESMILVGVAASRFQVRPVPANTIVIHGEVDDVVPLAAVFDWARPLELPVIVIPGTGHFFHGRLNLLKSLILRQLGAALG